LLLRRRWGLLEGRRVGEGWRSYEKEIIWIIGFESMSVCSERRRKGEHVAECISKLQSAVSNFLALRSQIPSRW